MPDGPPLKCTTPYRTSQSNITAHWCQQSLSTRYRRSVALLSEPVFSDIRNLQFLAQLLFISWPTFTLLSLPLCLECYNRP